MPTQPTHPYDPRYAYVTCSACQRRWQRIDYGSALHQLTCGYPLPPQVEPVPDRALTPEEWEVFDISIAPPVPVRGCTICDHGAPDDLPVALADGSGAPRPQCRRCGASTTCATCGTPIAGCADAPSLPSWSRTAAEIAAGQICTPVYRCPACVARIAAAANAPRTYALTACCCATCDGQRIDRPRPPIVSEEYVREYGYTDHALRLGVVPPPLAVGGYDRKGPLPAIPMPHAISGGSDAPVREPSLLDALLRLEQHAEGRRVARKAHREAAYRLADHLRKQLRVGDTISITCDREDHRCNCEGTRTHRLGGHEYGVRRRASNIGEYEQLAVTGWGVHTERGGMGAAFIDHGPEYLHGDFQCRVTYASDEDLRHFAEHAAEIVAAFADRLRADREAMTAAAESARTQRV